MRKKIIIIALIAFVLIEILAFVKIESFHDKEVSQYLNLKTEEFKVKQKAVEKTYALMVQYIFNKTINKPEVLQVFSKAYYADSLQRIIIRDSLYSLILSEFDYLKLNNIDQLQFHLPNNNSFLRFHSPEKYGDNLTNYRYSVKMTNINKKNYFGFEKGRIYTGFRSVFPLFYKDKHIGSVEISFSFEAINKQLKQHEGDIFGIIFKKDIVDAKIFKSEKCNYIKSLLSGKYVYEKENSIYKDDSLSVLKQIDKKISSKIFEKINNYENFTITTNINKQYYLISFVLISNIEEKPAAYIYSYKKDFIIPDYKRSDIITHISMFSLIALITFLAIISLLKIVKIKEIDDDYKNILDANNDMVLMVSVNGEQLYANKQSEILLGYKPDELIGKSFKIFIPKNEMRRYLRKLKDVFLTKKIVSFETVAIHKNGQHIPVEVTGKIMKHNGITVALGTFRDITNRKNAEAEIQKLSLAVEQSSVIVIITSIKGIVEFVNSFFTETTGYTFDEIKGENIRILKSGHTTKEEYSKLWETINSGKTWRGEFINIKKNKEKYWEKTVISPIKNNKGEIVNFIAIKEDITEFKKAQKALKVAKQEAETANRLKSEFLANMSHEIRTPMNAIVGFSNILKKSIKDKKEHSFIDKIVKSGNNLLELVNDILDLSKIEVGQLSIQKKPTNIYTLINEIPLVFYEVSERKQIPINIDIQDNISKSILIDNLRLRQILLNLVGNALKFTQKGLVSIRISANNFIKRDKNILFDLQIQVEDTGIGIPKNQMDFIFHSFCQVEGQSTRKYGGTGLGLAITKSITELMNGTISVESTIGKGSIFTVILKDIEVIDAHNENIINDEKSINIIFDKVKILHVEDDEYNREVVKLYFEGRNAEIKEAETGEYALQILNTYIPDLILMDIQMPKLSGYEIVKIIKQNKILKEIPIIAITANATLEEIEKYSYVFDEYITKPIDELKLINVVARYLEHSKEIITEQEEIENCIISLKKQKENIGSFSDEIKSVMKDELKPLYEKITNVISTEDLKDFAEKNEIYAKKYNILGLLKYSQELKGSIINFNIEKISEIRGLYPEIIKIICN